MEPRRGRAGGLVEVCLLAALVILATACTSGTAESAEEVSGEETTTSSVEPEFVYVDPPSGEPWRVFEAWAGMTTLVVDGSAMGELPVALECVNNECQEPVSYSSAVDLVLEAGSELGFEHPHVTFAVVPLRLTSELSFVREGEFDQKVRLDEPGLYHVQALGSVKNELGFENRFRHNVWLEVVAAGDTCAAPSRNIEVTGVRDPVGCPTLLASLNLGALHPEFHCAGWPPGIALIDEDRQFLRWQHNSSRAVRILREPPDDLEAMGLTIESGALHQAASIPDALFVLRDDGDLEWWAIPERESECM